jgi:hypothetical protein
MSKRKSTDDKLHSYRSDKNKQLTQSLWASGSTGAPKRSNSNNQFR